MPDYGDPPMLAMALRYVGAGIHVFPVNGKAPLTEHGFHDASAERDQVEAWWARYPHAGIATPDFDVVDVDLYKPHCKPTWQKIKPLIPANTPQTKTGGGGLQFFFAPGSLRDGKIGPGVDSRYAGRNYVLLPPSPHPDGGRYEAVVSVVERKPRPAPEFPLDSGTNGEFRQLLIQMEKGEKIVDGRNKAAWWRAVEILRTLPTSTELEPVQTLVQSWVDANCGGNLEDVDVPKQVRGAARFVAKERAGEPAAALEPPAYEGPPRPLEDVVAVFKKWLLLPDVEPVYAMLGAAAANYLPGTPVWLILVSPPSSGKTELLSSLGQLPDVHAASTLTVASLLSGTPGRDRAKRAKGGLLREIGEFGLVVLKDMGSLLSMRPDDKAEVFAALREVFDGSYVRYVGADGGRQLAWAGKIGLVAGATPVLDRHHGVLSVMGERFLLCRLPEALEAQAERALTHTGELEAQMRRELSDAVTALFAGERREPRPLDDHERHTLVGLAALVARARSPVERDQRTREVELVPGAEGPARLAVTLERLLAGLDTLGCDRATALRVLRRVGLDSMPALRRHLLEQLAAATAPVTTPTLAVATHTPTNTVRRALEDLAAYRLVDRTKQEQGKPDLWQVVEWAQERLR